MPAPMQKASFTARVRPEGFRPPIPDDDRQSHAPAAHPKHRPYHNSTAHLLTVLTPLVVGELINDPNKRWRWIRIGSVLSALANEMMWQHHINQEREYEEQQAKAR